jgi:DNA recombination protein RmuC
VGNAALVFAEITIAVIVVGFLGYWLGKSFAEKGLTGLETDKSHAEQRIQEKTDELTGVRNELAQVRSESAARAGFESLAGERGNTISLLTAERDGLRQELKAESEIVRTQVGQIEGLNTELTGERKNLAEKLALLDTAKEALANQFKALADEILERKTKSFSESSQEKLGTLLTPLKLQIEDFRKKVEEAQSDSKTGVTKLETLVGDLSGLNQKLSQEAHNLTTALVGSSSDQGKWGEEVAKDLLELAGFIEGVQYRLQQTVEANAGDDGGRQRNVRPDIIINLPGGRNLIIDSKVSLTAYYDSVKAESETERKSAIKKHLSSVHKHIDELTAKDYHRLQTIESPDFVVMFVPIEPAFLLAIHEDETLWHYAYERHILLVGPTTLLFVIRIVDNLWRQELQARSVKDVIKRGTALYEKFAGFVADIETIGKNLRGATESYENAKSKLSSGPGNLIRQVEMLKQLGIRTVKSVPQNLLDSAGFEETGLALAANAEESGEAE